MMIWHHGAAAASWITCILVGHQQSGLGVSLMFFKLRCEAD